MADLAPCPFCGVADCRPRNDDVAYLPPATRYVLCRGCGASGANVETEADAIAAWNRRAPTAASVDVLARELGKYGIDIPLPSDGDLDDREREKYDGLRAALTAAGFAIKRDSSTAEQAAHNGSVAGSTPARATISRTPEGEVVVPKEPASAMNEPRTLEKIAKSPICPLCRHNVPHVVSSLTGRIVHYDDGKHRECAGLSIDRTASCLFSRMEKKDG